MVRKIKCECSQYSAIDIDSWKLFQEMKNFFEEQEREGVYKSLPVRKPFHIGISPFEVLYYYADKWYKCNVCGCLWEFDYPEFPKHGTIRKFEDGKYFPGQH